MVVAATVVDIFQFNYMVQHAGLAACISNTLIGNVPLHVACYAVVASPDPGHYSTHHSSHVHQDRRSFLSVFSIVPKKVCLFWHRNRYQNEYRSTLLIWNFILLSLYYNYFVFF